MITQISKKLIMLSLCLFTVIGLYSQCCQCSQGGVLVGCFVGSACNNGQCSENKCADNFGGVAADYDSPVCVGGLCSGVTACAALPIELAEFSAELVKGRLELFWSTSLEINNAGFEVQISADGTDFKSVAWIEGNGNSRLINDYHIELDLLNAPINYLRLKQLDYNGQFEYSHVIAVSVNQSNKWSAYIYGEMIVFTNAKFAKYSVSDIHGRILETGLINSNSTSQLFDYKAGIYILALRDEHKSETFKLLKG